jgi:hypothetical protein
MKTRRILALLFSLTLVATSLVTAGAQDKKDNSQKQDSASDNSNPRRSLEGSWLVTATFTDPIGIPPFKVLFNFSPGKSDDEGTLIDTNEFQLTPNPVCSPDQGVWERTGNREFIATHYNFCFDALNMYAPAGPTKIRDSIKLSKDGESFAMNQYIEGFDTDNNLVFVGKVTASGVRLHAEAPPSY